MEKLMISITLIMICFLCSCKQTPNDVKTKEMSDDISVNYVSAEHILDDFNDAFETKYTKFKLPKKSDVIIDQPEEVNKLELKYVNSNGDEKWMKNKEKDLLKMFNDNNAMSAEEKEKSYIETRVFSRPYYNYEPLLLNELEETKYEFLNRKKITDFDGYIQNAVKKSVKISDEANKILEGELTNIPIDLTVYDNKGKSLYETCMQPCYKGIGIMGNIPALYNYSSADDNSDTLIAMAMRSRVIYDNDLRLYMVNNCNNFKVVKSESIDNIISFKSACNILESTLSEKIELDFNDVKLWYEPIGKILSSEDKEVTNHVVKCTPKWYFINDSTTDGMHMINYISVDCETGDVDVCMP